MTARGKLYMGFLKNKDGSEKKDITLKQMESFSVREGKDPIFLLDYHFENGTTYTITFFENSLHISGNIEGEEESTFMLKDDGDFYSDKCNEYLNKFFEELNNEFEAIDKEYEQEQEANEEKKDSNAPEEPPSNPA